MTRITPPKGPRTWPSNATFREAFDTVLTFFRDCRENRIPLGLQEPTLYRAYLVESAWPDTSSGEISRFIKFGKQASPPSPADRQAIAPLLAVAVKAHFFLAEGARLIDAPSIIRLPDLSRPGAFSYGLVYSLGVPTSPGVYAPSREVTIVVASWDLALCSQAHVPHSRLGDFPVVLLPDSMTWLNRSLWRSLRDRASPLTAPERGTVLASVSPRSAVDPARRQALLRELRESDDPAVYPYGIALDFPIDLREDVSATGALWSPGMKKWILPHGFDPDPVVAYLDLLSTLDEQGRHARRWWQRRPRKAPVRKGAAKRSAADPDGA